MYNDNDRNDDNICNDRGGDNSDSKDDNNYKHSDDDNDADLYQLAMMILKLIL